jgi:MoxR-like ATPase
MTNQTDIQLLEKLGDTKKTFFNEIGKSIIGQQNVLDHILIALLCKGHTLIVGVPGLAKTLMIKSMAELLDLDFSRIQFTPDLMPSDITGTELIEADQSTGKRVFRFFKGPVFGNIILADEINRTPPKTQAALLEAMQEHKVTASGNTYDLEEPFFVLATQNPIEQEGTYPLPEAQLDRFMFNILIDYPDRDEEISIVQATTSTEKPQLDKVISRQEILEYQGLVRRVPVADNVVEYAVDLVSATRPGDNAKEFINEWIDCRWIVCC